MQQARCPECGAILLPDVSAEQCPSCLMRLGLKPAELLDDPSPDEQVGLEAANEGRYQTLSRLGEAGIPVAPSAYHGKRIDIRILETLGDGALESLESRDFPAPPGATIGPYRIERELGRGGMGVVYLAEQEVPIRRHVALKLIQFGMNTRQVVARFEAERQALALMNHPNIAHVYDAGSTSDGRLFFAMEYVPGVPITDFCDAHRLSTRARLELIVDVCAAIQHAHQKGVIHRDLKPSNILVTEQDGHPVPKVIDFGIARATKSPEAERSLFTEHGLLVGTPEYMSPEQAALSADIDTTTDVYSLGVLLYELLVGALPFDPKALRAAGYDDMRRIIRETDPPRPSTRFAGLGDEATNVAARRDTDIGRLARQLRGDIDWITLKALEKDRRRRYLTPAALAAELGRYLEHEPVKARPPSLAYRSRKFVRRHRSSVAAAAALLLTLIVGLVVSVTLYVRADYARREATEQRELADLRRRDAESSASDARRQRDEADVQRRLADRQRSAAEAATRKADQQQDEAERQRRDAQQQRDEAVHEKYRSILLSADLSLRQGDTEQAHRQLSLTEPALRGWEWQYLRRAADSSVAQFRLLGDVSDVAFRGSNDEVVATMPLSRTGLVNIRLNDPAEKVLREIIPRQTADRPPNVEFNSVAAVSSDGMRALAVGWNARLTLTRCEGQHESANTVVCQPARAPTIADQTGRWLTPEERDRLLVTDTRTGEILATLRHPNVGVWKGPKSESFPTALSRLLPAPVPSLVTLVDGSTGRAMATLSGHYPDVVGAVFSADTTQLATWSWDNIIYVWDLASESYVAALRGHGDAIRTVVFSKSMTELVSSSSDGTVRFWTIATGRETASLRVAGATVIAISPSDSRIAVGTETGAIQIWEHGATAPKATLSGHGGSITALAFSPDSATLASASDADPAIELWDLQSGIALGRLAGHTRRVLALAWSADGKRLASGAGDSTVRIWNTSEARPAIKLTGHTKRVGAVAFSAASGHLVSTAMDGTIRVWDEARAQPLRTINYDAEPGQSASRPFVTIGAAGRRVAVPYYARGTSGVRLMDMESGATTRLLWAPDSETITRVTESPNGAAIAVVSGAENGQGTLQMWDAASGRLIVSATIDRLLLSSGLAFSPAGDRLAVVVIDRLGRSQIRLFDAVSGTFGQTISMSTTSFSTGLTFTSDGTKLVCACSTEQPGFEPVRVTAAIWNVGSGQRVASLQEHDGPVTAAVVSPDGARILTGAGDGTVRVWDAERYELLLTLRTESNVGSSAISALAISADGRRIAAGTDAGTIYIWNAGGSVR